ncbi:MAG: hypothetical protein GY941_21605 [Planctomycetes bacterium]|nr:hypothetical protein [Planctomycetota bacterium]
MGFWTTLAVAGATAGSTFMQARAAADAERGQAAQMRHAADIDERDALAIDIDTDFRQIRTVEAGERHRGSLKASLGGSGAIVSEGAPSELLAEQDFENALEVALIGQQGNVAASRLRSQAAGQRAGAKFADKRSRNALLSGVVGAGVGLLGDMYTMRSEGMFANVPGLSKSSGSSKATQVGFNTNTGRPIYQNLTRKQRAKARANRAAWGDYIRHARSVGSPG